MPRGPSPGPPAPAQCNNSDADPAFSESTLSHYEHHTKHFGSSRLSKCVFVLITWILLKSIIWIALYFPLAEELQEKLPAYTMVLILPYS